MKEKEIRENTQDAKERLTRLREFSLNPVDQRVETFARFLAGRINFDQINPREFITTALLAQYDLQTGVDGYSGKPLRTGLENPPPFINDLLWINTPDLAYAAFSRKFGDEVKRDVQAVFKAENIKEDEVVKRPIRTINDAMDLIISSAAYRVADLDWAHFGDIDNKDVERFFAKSHGVFLKAFGRGLPITVFDQNNNDEARVIKSLPDEKKFLIAPDVWECIVSFDDISVEYATFIRDYLYTTLNLVSVRFGLNPQEVDDYFLENDDVYLRSSGRSYGFMKRNKLI